MADTRFPQSKKKDSTNKTRSEFLKSAYEDVWQDTYAVRGVRAGSAQAVRIGKSPRTHALSKNSDRVQKRVASRNTVIAASHVPQPISMLIDQRAREWDVTRSRAILRLIELGLEKLILQANTNLLVSAVKEVLVQECRRFFSRITAILFRIFLILCQVLHVQKNLLARSGYQKRLSPEDLDRIIAWSRTQAKDDVVKGTRGGDSLDQAIEAWLTATAPDEERDRE